MEQTKIRRKFRMLTRAGLSFFRKFHISDEEILILFKPGFENIRTMKRYFADKSPLILEALSEGRVEAIHHFKKNFPEAFKKTMERACEIRQGKIKLLGYTFTMERGEIDWYLEPFSKTHFKKVYWRIVNSGIGTEILYTRELHKHQYLVNLAKAFYLTNDEEYVRVFISIMQDWIDKNPLEIGPAYTSTLNVSQRIISWLLAWPFLQSSKLFRENFILEFIKALYGQAYFIRHNSTAHWRPLTNYFIAENTALFLVAALLPELKESREWISLSMENLNIALKQQVWPDGISFEQSTGYQKLIIDFIMLAVIASDMNEIELPADVRCQLLGLCDSLMNLGQPNGEIVHIGDISTESGFILSADDDLLDIKKHMSLGALIFKREDMKYSAKSFREEAFWFFGHRGAREFSKLDSIPPEYKSRAFREGGYFIMRNGWEENAHHLLIDCGYTGLGTDGLGGHGHNDILHFTLSAWGRPFIVDSGTYIFFGSEEWRNYFRSTSAHNTVVIDGKETSEFGKGLFKIKSNVKPILNDWDSDGEYDFFSGSHTGYTRLKSPVLHTREILFVKESYWIINDILEAKGRHELEVFFHLAPMPIDIDKTTLSARTNNTDGPNLVIIPVGTKDLKGDIEEGWISNYYGMKERAPIVRYYRGFDFHFALKAIIFPLARGEEVIIDQVRSEALAEWVRYFKLKKRAVLRENKEETRLAKR